MDQFENTLCNTSGKKSKRSTIFKRIFLFSTIFPLSHFLKLFLFKLFFFPLFKEKYMSHLYGTGEITIAWQFAFCLVGNLFLEAKSQSIESIAGDEFLQDQEACYLMLETRQSLFFILAQTSLIFVQLLGSRRNILFFWCGKELFLSS